MKAALRRRLALLSILLILGVVAGAAIIALGAEKAITGTSSDYISVVKPPQASQLPNQRATQLAQHEARLKSFVAIANKDERVQRLVAGKNYAVVGIGLIRGPTVPPGINPNNDGALVLRVEGKFYKITIDITHEQVISIEQRTCYGPACND
ncbi:MAG: hypothetical protein WBZ42_02425 [Halobacteriota archaeon]